MKSGSGHWFCASWRIMDAAALHEEICELLGKGTECHVKGDLIPGQPGERWPNDIWSISAAVPEKAHPEVHLRWLFDRILPHLPAVHRWREAGARMDIFLSYGFTEDHNDFSLSPQAMKALANLGIPLVVSVAV